MIYWHSVSRKNAGCEQHIIIPGTNLRQKPITVFLLVPSGRSQLVRGVHKGSQEHEMEYTHDIEVYYYQLLRPSASCIAAMVNGI